LSHTYWVMNSTGHALGLMGSSGLNLALGLLGAVGGPVVAWIAVEPTVSAIATAITSVGGAITGIVFLWRAKTLWLTTYQKTLRLKARKADEDYRKESLVAEIARLKAEIKFRSRNDPGHGPRRFEEGVD
jgi:hypothetical protein